MTLGDLLARLRTRLRDVSEPYLWKTPELMAYLNEAIDEAADRARLIYDENSAVTSFDVVPATAIYNLDICVLDVDRVRLDGRLLQRTTKMDLDRGACPPFYGDYGSPFDNDSSSGGSLSGQGWEARTGRPYAFIEEVNSIQLYPSPTVAGKLSLSLWRTQIEPVEGKDDEPPLQRTYHARLLDWALHLCYLNRDSDSEDRARAAEHEARFEASFGPRREANVQRKQKIKRIPVVRPRW